MLLPLLVGSALAGAVLLDATATAGWDREDGTDRMVVDRGLRDGVVDTGVPLRVYRYDAGGLSLVEVGYAKVEAISRSETTVIVTVPEGGDTKIGDHVVLVTDREPPSAPSVAWDLALRGIEVREADGKHILNDWKRLRRDADAIPDATFCEAVAAEVRASGPAMIAEYPELDQRIPDGRYEGQLVSEAMATLGAEEACRGLRYLIDLVPEAFTQDGQTASSLVLAWIGEGGSMPEAELRARLTTATDAELQDLIARHGRDLTYALRWFEMARMARESDDYDEVRALAAVLERFAGATGVPYDQGMAARVRAIVLQIDGDAVAAEAKLREAIPLQPGSEAVLLADIANVQAYARDPRAEATFAEALALGDIGARWEQYGNFLANADRYDEALDAFGRCIAFHEARPNEARSRIRLGWCRWGLAYTHNRASRYQEALPWWDAAIAHAERYGPVKLLANSKHGKGVAMRNTGQAFASIALFDQASTELDADGWPGLASQAARDGVIALTMVGDVRRAAGWLDWAVHVLRQNDPDENLALTLWELGTLQVRVGDPQAGLTLYAEAARVFAETGGSNAYLVSLSTATALRDLDREEEARAAADHAVELAAASGSRRALLDARSQRAHFRRDEAELVDVLAAMEAEDWPVGIARTRLRLGWLRRKQGRLDEAHADATAAAERAAGFDRYAAAEAEWLLGEIAIDRGELKAGSRQLAHATEEMDAIDEPYALHEASLAFEDAVLLYLGGLPDGFYEEHLGLVTGNDLLREESCGVEALWALGRLRVGDVAGAERLAQTARRHAEQVDDRRWEARSSLVLAEIAWLRGELEATSTFAEHAATLVRSLPEPDPALRIEALQWQALGAADPAVAGRLATEALDLEPRLPVDRTYARMVRARVEPDRAVNLLMAAIAAPGRVDPTRRDAARRALIAALLAQGDVAGAQAVVFEREEKVDPITFAANQRALSDVAAAAGDAAASERLRRAGDRLPRLLERRAAGATNGTYRDGVLALQEAHPELGFHAALAPEELAAQLADLRPEEALVMPVVLPDRVLLFVARGGEAEPTWVEVPADNGRVNDLVDQLRSRLQRPGDAWEQSRGVRVVAADSGGGSTRDDPTAPARELYALLMAPLSDRLEGVETVVFAPSGRLRYVPFAALFDGERYLVERYRVALLTPSGSTTAHRPIDRSRPLLAMSNPDGSLPGASAEVAAITRSWGKKRVRAYDGAAATEEQLRDDLGDAGILHLATHGFLLEDAPRDSYLLFAGEEGESRLTVREITLLPLDNVDLAVLSACQTAVGDAGEGKEIAGLAYQLEVRGAAAIVASLWAVNDAGTSELMAEMYAGLAKGGATRSEALREAQLRLLGDERLRHPYYWAPFVLIGDWR